MDAFADKILIEARNDSIQLEQIAVADLEKNIDGYIEPNWRTRRMVDDWREYVANCGKTGNDEYLNMRAAFSETKGRSNKVFSDVLASHTRKASYDLSKSMFGRYVAAAEDKSKTSAKPVNGEGDKDQKTDLWQRVIRGASRHLELHGWWKCRFLAPDPLVKSLRNNIEAQLEKDHGVGVEHCYSGHAEAKMQLKVNSNIAATFEEMFELAADPLLLSIVQEYMGVPPIFNTPVAFLNSFVKPNNERALSDVAQLYHHDMHRLGFVKVFAYLTDVGPGSGPHTLVRGTHRIRPDHLWADGRHTDEAIKNAGLGNDEVDITGKAGTVFLVDTSSLHKGTHPKSNARLMAQVQYTNSLFGKPIPDSDHKVELAASSENQNVQKTATFVRKYAEVAGIRFMQNYI